MKSPRNASELLDLYFLHMRSALVETAASFDRIQRAEGSEGVWRDGRLEDLRRAAAILADDEPDRAARILEVLSLRGEVDA
jgi:hypothetical protein